jgi:hypothetical protein
MEPSEKDILLAARTMADAIPPPPLGHLRLWRSQTTATRDRQGWLLEQLQRKGILEAEGRWFTPSLEAVAWYAKDGWSGNPKLIFIDMEIEDAQRRRVDVVNEIICGRSPYEFSLDPESEFFLSRFQADISRDMNYRDPLSCISQL